MAGAASGIEGMGEGGAFTRLAASALGEDLFRLVDVGCAGGLAPGWRVFGDRLAAIGIDAHEAEVVRLNAVEPNPKVRYLAGMVGLPEGHPLRARIDGKAYWHHWPAMRFSWERSLDLRRAHADGRAPTALDAYYIQDVLGQDWLTTPRDGFDLDYAADLASAPAFEAADPKILHLPDQIRLAGFEDVDFLKLDVDGPDYEVLRSMAGLLARPSLLGVAIEVSFFGSHDANDNTFHNVDRLMREKGFDLFALSKRSYSSAALPWPFLDEQPGKSAGGRPGQGDAIYLRDLGSRVRSSEAADVSDTKLVKAAALLSLIDLHDWAAELLVVHRQRLSRILDVDHALQLLAEDIQRGQAAPLAYGEYISRFEAEDPRFFGQAPRPETPTASADTQGARVAELERRLRAIEASASWRVTEPLRRLAGALKRPRGAVRPSAGPA